MPDAEFIVDIQTTTTLNEFGNNEITFLFTANKGSLPKDLSKVASGGEMSRLMLCIKAMLVEKTALPTIIFDEIDTGVSGDIALKMGNIMFVMAQRMQLLTITHLAQIAAKGQHHLHVVKEVIDDKTNSNIIEIKEETRIQEIAKMLSSANPTKAAVENAKELLELKQ
jgi:DNA repair protein RecN (Recombination protein N)